MSNRKRRLFHSHAMKFPFVNMYASWVFGVDILDLTYGMQMSRCWTSAFDDHFDHCFAVLKDVEHRNESRRLRVSTKDNRHYSIQKMSY